LEYKDGMTEFAANKHIEDMTKKYREYKKVSKYK